MAIRKITITADHSGNIAEGQGIADGCIFVYTGETLHIKCTVTSGEGELLPADTLGFYDAAVCRDADGTVLAGACGTQKEQVFIDESGVLNIVLDTGSKAMAAAAANGFESCTLHIIHYPAGTLYGEVIVKVPLLLEPACCSSAGWREPEEEKTLQLPDRCAPALETFTGTGWQLDGGNNGTAWRWRFADGTLTPVLPVHIPDAGYDIAGNEAERDELCAGREDCDFAAVDTNMIYLKRAGKWSSGIQWQGEKGTDAVEAAADVLFLPFTRTGGKISYELHNTDISSASVLPPPLCVYIDAVASCRGQAELIWKDRAGNILTEKSYQLNAGRNTLTADFSAASAAFPTELFLHCSLHGEWGEMQLTAENISCIFPAAQIPLPDNWTFLPRIGDNTAAGRVLGGKWQWTGKCMVNTGVIGSDGFLAGEDDGSWGIECGIDLREYASWSICGVFRIKEAPGASRKVLFRAGDPGGNGDCCIAGCLAEYDGKGGGRVVFRLNCSGTVQEAVVPLVPEKLFKPFIVMIVRDSIRNRMGVTVHGHGCEWLPLPENSVVPFSVPGTAHPLLEAGCCVPDRLSYSSEGCGIRSLFATDLPLTEGGAVFIARLMS